MLKAYVYKRRGVEQSTVAIAKQATNTSWLHAVKPSKKELQEISDKLKIPTAELNIYLDPKERARVEKREGYTIIILKTPVKKKEFFLATTLAVFISKNFLLSMIPQSLPSFEKFAKDKIEMNRVFQKGQDHVVYSLLSQVTKDYGTSLADMEEQLDKIETRIVDKGDQKATKKLFHIRKSVLYLRKGVVDNHNVMDSIEEGLVPHIRSRKQFHHLYIEYLQMSDVIAVLGERITSLTELSFSSISNKLNKAMKSFTVLASVLLLPTLIAGIYGMNFRIIPLSQLEYGFWILIGIMIAAVAITLGIFKKVGWI